MTKWTLSLMGLILLSGTAAAQQAPPQPSACFDPPCINYQVNWLQDALFIFEVDQAGLLDSRTGGAIDYFGSTPQQIGQSVMNLDAYLTLDGGVGPSPYELPEGDGAYGVMQAYLSRPVGSIYDPFDPSDPIYIIKNPISRVSAPEIDPASVGSGLTLLLGGLMVLRGRRDRVRN